MRGLGRLTQCFRCCAPLTVMLECLAVPAVASLMLVMAAGPVAAQEPLVINEVLTVPTGGNVKFIEMWNRGNSIINLNGWWICDQPSSIYVRLLQKPYIGGPPPTDPPIVLAPGDILVLRWTTPAGNYTTQPNQLGSVTHIANAGVPGTVGMGGAAGTTQNNFSIWDFSLTPTVPDFTLVAPVHDHLAWSPTAIYTGFKRNCNAVQKGIWPMPLVGTCPPGVDTPTFVAVDTNTNVMPAASGVSINYNGQNSDSPTDYFLAAATPGEPNVMPGDLDNDLDIDDNDADLFGGCFGMAWGGPVCMKADADTNGTVDCDDWTAFLDNWARYSTLPPPSFAPCEGCGLKGDFNVDSLRDAEDIQGFVDVFIGVDMTPLGQCRADIDDDLVVDNDDLISFVYMLCGGALTCVRGDANQDGHLDADDINGYLAVLLNPNPGPFTPIEFCRYDMNSDAMLSPADIDAFIEALLYNM